MNKKQKEIYNEMNKLIAIYGLDVCDMVSQEIVKLEFFKKLTRDECLKLSDAISMGMTKARINFVESIKEFMEKTNEEGDKKDA